MLVANRLSFGNLIFRICIGAVVFGMVTYRDICRGIAGISVEISSDWVSVDGFDTRWIPRSFSCGIL